MAGQFNHVSRRGKKSFSRGWKWFCSFWSRRWQHWLEERSPWFVIILEGLFGFGAIVGTVAAVYLEFDSTKHKWPQFVPYAEDFHKSFGDVHTIMSFVLCVITLMYGKLFKINQRLADKLDRATSQLTRATLPTEHCDLFAGLFAKCGNSTTGDQFKAVAHRTSYITIHSEVLYYTMLCSLIESLRSTMISVCRSHIFIPGAPSSLFLTEILKVLPENILPDRYYIFRNDLLDYNRASLYGRGDETQRHLWSTFAAASRVLFQDTGAHYGYDKTYSSSPSIWDESLHWPDGFHRTCERVLIETRDHGRVTAIVERDPATFKFKEARISVGDEGAAITEAHWPATDDYFQRLRAARQRDEARPAGEKRFWTCADHWEQYPLEVALISGTEMELHAQPGVILWAVDDFDLEDFPTGTRGQWSEMEWLKEGSPRYLAWSKSIATCLKKAKVRRLFLVDQILFNPSTMGQDGEKVLALFTTMAIQHRFLSAGDPAQGEVKLLFKSRKCKLDHAYPDYSILAEDDAILGGVIWKPVPRYMRENDERFLDHMKKRWDDGLKFPDGCLPVKNHVLANAKEIAKAITRVELLDDQAATETEIKKREDWLTTTLK